MKLPGLVPPPASVSNRRPAGPAKVRMAVVRMPGQTPKAALGRSSTVEHRARRSQTPRDLWLARQRDRGGGSSAASPSAGSPRPGSWGKCGAGLWPGCPSRLPREIGVARRPAWLGFVAALRKEGNTSLRLPVSPGAEPGHREDGRRLYRSHHVMCRVW